MEKRMSVVLGAFVENEGRVLLLKRRDDDLSFPGKWEIPGGHMKDGETIAGALQREIKEETNLDLVSFAPASSFEYDVAEEEELHCIEVDFLCTVQQLSKLNISSEHTQYAWVSKSEIENYDMTEDMKNSILRCFGSAERELRSETEKWLERIRAEQKNVVLKDAARKDFLTNIDAYIEDTTHFLNQKDYVRAFEAVIWAWAWLSIGKELGVLK